MSPHRFARETGFSMLEVLITLLILAFGLLGVAGLQARMQVAEMEAYQRAQATMLLRDMSDRLHANRKNAVSYVTPAPLGAGKPVSDCSALTGPALDLCEWNSALLGVSESLNNAKVGAMIDARGCVEMLSATMPRVFRVAVAWQGLNGTAAPQASACGAGQYGNEQQRRVIVSTVVIACLQNDPASGLCVTP